ncbi:MaoC family dehydratase N-terminal domain-containing protein [Rugosimonospora acidiphila]|uniref:MaoC family dehydratase N-terminal domain-containing protein n=1 Tax=Rugosimonospora acidiphila TaxID=556531 RepID=A0ABP9SJX0_9ACTN
MQTCRELITPGPAEELAALLDLEVPGALRDGFLPPLWHWVYLLDRPRQDELGADGHPLRGVPAPPGPGWLRMFAGGRVTAYRAVRVGRAATRTSEVARTVEKSGRSGPLTFVTVRSRIEQDGAVAVVDEQDIVYRPPGSRPPTAAPTVPAGGAVPGPNGADPNGGSRARGASVRGTLEFDVDPVVLFRFSALTHNAHRIHYDLGYTTGEGYPDLVVHGPLQALLLGELIRRLGVDPLGRAFSYRLVGPAYGAQRLSVAATGDGPDLRVEVRDGAGRVTATGALAA